VGDAGAPVFELTNVNETTGTANAFIIGVLSTSQDAPEVVFSNSVPEVVFSNSVPEVVFSNSVPEVVFSNSVSEVVFSNSVALSRI
jgi:hypothetical protein